MSPAGPSGTDAIDTRPARASSLALAGIAGLLVGLLAVVTWSASIGLAGVSAAGLAWSIRRVNRESLQSVAIGTLVGFVGSCGVVVAHLLPGAILPTFAAATTVFGAIAALTNGLGDGRALAAIRLLLFVTLAMVAVSVAIILGLFGAILVQMTFDTVVPANAGPDLVGFATLLTLAVVAVRSALRGLPIVELAPKADRQKITRLVETAETTLTRALWVSIAGLVGGLFLALVLQFLTLPAIVVALISIPAGSPILRAPLFGLIVIAGSVAVGIRILRWTGVAILDWPRESVAVGVGLAITLCLMVLSPLYADVLSTVPGLGQLFQGDLLGQVWVLLMLIVWAMAMVLSVLLILPLVVTFGLADGRSVGSAMAAAGLVGAAMAVGTITHPLVVIVLVVGAVVVWDLGEFAVGLGEEVGRRVDTGQVEGVHAAGSLGVGVLAFGLAGGAYGLVQVFTASGRIALLALAAAVAGAFLLVAAVRG